MLCHRSLMMYYQSIFLMTQHHKYDIETLENLYSFEFDLYFSLLVDLLKRLEEARNRQ